MKGDGLVGWYVHLKLGQTLMKLCFQVDLYFKVQQREQVKWVEVSKSLFLQI